MVHSAKDFVLAEHNYEAQTSKYTFDAKASVADIAANIDALVNSFRLWAPKFVITPSYYTNKDGVFDNASFTVRPSTKNSRDVGNLKKTFTVYAGENFYVRFANNLLSWFSDYETAEKLYDNLEDFQKIWDEAIEENNIPFAVKFALGDGIVDVSDTYIVIGLAPETVKAIAQRPCYNTLVVGARDAYKAAIADVLSACAIPMDIVKQNTAITKDLGIFSRKSLVKLIRKCVTRRISYVRTGVGYYECDEYFAIIQKTAVTAEEAAKIAEANPGAYIVDNKNASKAEAAAGATKIYVAYKVSPFNDNRETLNIPVKDIPGVIAE